MDKHLEKAKYELTKDIAKSDLKIHINQVKKAGFGASVENGPTTDAFLAKKNREKVHSLIY